MTVVDKPLRRPRSAGEAGEVGAQAANAMIDLRGKGVDRVLFVPSGGAIPFIVGTGRGRTSGTSRAMRSRATTSRRSSPTTSDGQLANAVALGWMPTNDTYLPQAGTTEGLERCFKAAGVRNATVVRYCDGLFFLKDSLDRTPLFSIGGLKRAAYALDDDFKSPWAMSVKVAPNRHDGATSYRLMRFKSACSCFVFEGAAKPIP